MAEQTDGKIVAQIAELVNRYGFELRESLLGKSLESWLERYSAQWIRLAVIEALYQGRYKAISVEHILDLWGRRGQVTFHFTPEFERLICRNLPDCFCAPSQLGQELAAASPPSTGGTGPFIHQFTPLLDSSKLYAKLRAVVHQSWEQWSPPSGSRSGETGSRY